MSRAETLEAVAMLVIIMAWWPAIFLRWDAIWYRVPLYVLSLTAVLIIFVRRIRRLHEALSYSRRLIEQQQQLKGAPLPPLTIQPPPPDNSRQQRNNGASQDQT